ncbi:DUF4920 domain-containing protein [Brumimicrobium aurantiacum]|uniref:DUF4920 domain-containing protein n=1 Tax=Brumimicrobium aurantiacum TaxID=1737063 RepID=A0A3E1EUL9_9FLAO|nr:DUF4920 domain-containing protein [Brumimicrobium aurantiacum]RFC53266.1 DUF4920 domain-containing protein [Brumimicrobium aurantiacum]
MNKKYLLIGLLAAGMLTSCGAPAETEEVAAEVKDTVKVDVGPVAQDVVDTTKTSFGPNKVDTSIAITTAELLEKFEGKTELEATFKGEINETCSKMGCWVNIAQDDGETFMVRFKDHFTIPVETEPGTMAYLSGKAIQDTVSVDMQKHFLEDANAPQEEIDAITEPKYTMTFIADGIELVK